MVVEAFGRCSWRVSVSSGDRWLTGGAARAGAAGRCLTCGCSSADLLQRFRGAATPTLRDRRPRIHRPEWVKGTAPRARTVTVQRFIHVLVQYTSHYDF